MQDRATHQPDGPCGSFPAPPRPLRPAYISQREHVPTQGRHASTDELAASAYQAVFLDQKYNNEPVQVRVTMGKEPAHLMAIFKGKMVVYEVSTGLVAGWANWWLCDLFLSPLFPERLLAGGRHGAGVLHSALPRARHQRVQHQGLRGARPSRFSQLQRCLCAQDAQLLLPLVWEGGYGLDRLLLVLQRMGWARCWSHAAHSVGLQRG